MEDVCITRNSGVDDGKLPMEVEVSQQITCSKRRKLFCGPQFHYISYNNPNVPEESHSDSVAFEPLLMCCGLFPPDHEYDKDSLIQMWLALRFFVDEPMEFHASLYFDHLVAQGCFQFSRTIRDDRAMYKFTNTNTTFLNTNNNSKLVGRIDRNYKPVDVPLEVEHLSVNCNYLQDYTFLERFKQLRSLIFLQGLKSSYFREIPLYLFPKLYLLQILDLSKTNLKDLPSSIACLNHRLRYLDLSYTPICELPESIDMLTKLQTLKLRECLKLRDLPSGLTKLVNLRHLEFDIKRQLTVMPEGIGNLTNIRTLSAFIVGYQKLCSITQLQSLDYITGSFRISDIEKVLTEKEAQEACLSNKSLIKSLELDWTIPREDAAAAGHAEILSALEPSTNLEELLIACFGGSEIPSWVSHPSFSKLVHITLFNLANCVTISPFGDLPSLKILKLYKFHKLRVIGPTFCGSIPGNVGFPNLENLEIENMSSLEEWSQVGTCNFPRLTTLSIICCPKLHKLCPISSFRSLEALELSHCRVLSLRALGKLPSQLKSLSLDECPLIRAPLYLYGGEDWLSHIPEVRIDNEELSHSSLPYRLMKMKI